ncbi:hypothetical protein AO715_14465 [Xanthomonas sp. Mitacek01]|nr:hypothetical protein AO715_14465 [Xanthomonas sp. Mitacek01]
MHCFACGDTAGVLASLGLKLADLYERPQAAGFAGSGRPSWPSSHLRNALKVAAYEALIVLGAAKKLAQHGELQAEDRSRLIEAAERLGAAREAMR